MEAVLRNLLVTDWIIILYVISLLLLVTAKKYSNYKFLDFSKLILTDTYLKTYRDDSLLKAFHVIVVGFSILFFPLIVQSILFQFGYFVDFSVFDYFNILLVFSVFFFLKMLLQLVFAKIFRINDKIRHYIFEKQTYFGYLIFISLVPLLFLIYTPFTTVFVCYVFVFMWITLFALAMLLVIFHFKELFFSHSLYFILYLCAFEIGPIVGAIFFMRRL